MSANDELVDYCKASYVAGEAEVTIAVAGGETYAEVLFVGRCYRSWTMTPSMSGSVSIGDFDYCQNYVSVARLVWKKRYCLRT